MDLFLRGRLLIQEELSHVVVAVGEVLHQLVVVLVALGAELLGDFIVPDRLSKAAVKIDGSVSDNVDQAFELHLLPHGKLQQGSVVAQLGSQLAQHSERTGFS